MVLNPAILRKNQTIHTNQTGHLITLKLSNKKDLLIRSFLYKWGGQWDSNPRIMEPQSMVLTA